MMIIPVGIDVSKHKLDIYFGDLDSFVTIGNNAESINNTFQERSAKNIRIVLEATGKYHRLAHAILDNLGYEVIVINPYQARNFARALNIQCKTDKIDAKILSQYGVSMPCHPQTSMSNKEEKIQELTRHLDDLKKLRKELKCRKNDSKGFVSKSLDKTIKTLDKEIKSTESRLDKEIDESPELKEKAQLLESIPGVGRLTACVLLSLMRELGSLTKAQVSSLAGLAPMNWDSGMRQGRRRIGRGRHDVRRHLYMPILGAVTKHNKRLIAIYNRMVEAGKPKMVAITACMRKLVIWANAILASGKKWDLAVN